MNLIIKSLVPLCFFNLKKNEFIIEINLSAMKLVFPPPRFYNTLDEMKRIFTNSDTAHALCMHSLGKGSECLTYMAAEKEDTQKIVYAHELRAELAQLAYHIFSHITLYLSPSEESDMIEVFDEYLEYRKKLLTLTGQCNYWY